jgi:hypothetical protein
MGINLIGRIAPAVKNGEFSGAKIIYFHSKKFENNDAASKAD